MKATTTEMGIKFVTDLINHTVTVSINQRVHQNTYYLSNTKYTKSCHKDKNGVMRYYLGYTHVYSFDAFDYYKVVGKFTDIRKVIAIINDKYRNLPEWDTRLKKFHEIMDLRERLINLGKTIKHGRKYINNTVYKLDKQLNSINY